MDIINSKQIDILFHYFLHNYTVIIIDLAGQLVDVPKNDIGETEIPVICQCNHYVLYIYDKMLQ